MKKLLAVLISVFLLAMGGLILTACGGKDGGGTTNGGDEQIRAVYNQYVAYADEKGETPLSYEEWLKTIKGEDGKSAYQIWLDNGNTGSEQDFLNWLKGGGQANVETLQYRMNPDRKSYSVIGLGMVSDLDVVIPSTYRGLPVTSIGDYVFEDCRSLTSVVIPDSVTSIGGYVFYDCRSLTSITIGKSLTNIAYDVFDNCSALKSVYYNGTIDEWVQINFQAGDSNPLMNGAKLYINNELVTEANITTATSICGYAFYGCSSLTSVVIGNSVTSIGYSAFYGCSSLTSVVIGDSVTMIGNGAFENCTSLTSIVIPDSVISIGYAAFYNCSSLTSVEIPDSVTSIGNVAFSGCENLQCNIEGNIKYIGTSTNKYLYLVGVTSNEITSATINKNCRLINSSAFLNCYSLTSIVIPDSVTSIGYSLFRQCYSLETIYCEAESKPDGWDENWNYCYNNNVGVDWFHNVVWGNEWEYVDGVPTIKDEGGADFDAEDLMGGKS